MHRFVVLGVLAALLSIVETPSRAVSLAERTGAAGAELAGVVPALNTAIATRTFYVGGIVLINNAGSNKTVNIRDRSTNCAAGPCRLVPTDLLVNAGSIYPISLPWVAATSGIQLSASATGQESASEAYTHRGRHARTDARTHKPKVT